MSCAAATAAVDAGFVVIVDVDDDDISAFVLAFVLEEGARTVALAGEKMGRGNDEGPRFSLLLLLLTVSLGASFFSPEPEPLLLIFFFEELLFPLLPLPPLLLEEEEEEGTGVMALARLANGLNAPEPSSLLVAARLCLLVKAPRTMAWMDVTASSWQLCLRARSVSSLPGVIAAAAAAAAVDDDDDEGSVVSMAKEVEVVEAAATVAAAATRASCVAAVMVDTTFPDPLALTASEAAAAAAAASANEGEAVATFFTACTCSSSCLVNLLLSEVLDKPALMRSAFLGNS